MDIEPKQKFICVFFSRDFQMAVNSLDNWSGLQSLDTSGSMNDPLVEQINIIKGYVKQAREAMRFEEVILNYLIIKKCIFI